MGVEMDVGMDVDVGVDVDVDIGRLMDSSRQGSVVELRTLKLQSYQ